MRKRKTAKTKTMAKVKTTYGEFVANTDRRRLLERESLAFEATELISKLMEEQNISKAELAKRIDKSRAYVTQLLSGSRNITMHTFSDLAFALGHRAGLRSMPLEAVRDECDCVMSYDVASNWLAASEHAFVSADVDSGVPVMSEESFAHAA